ncbi:hypothetical protein GGX14DRAFT_595078 [Mycena pura]|uniref:Uncharacterized protein n=1 Tax=Mycena pura TaxID=153505 RepID=A0AAD6VSS4_9AGAR|nr:hypothetical protein GGX14DRAFT_595078 [Mycena pura]
MPPRRVSSPTSPSDDLDADLLAAMESSSPFRPAAEKRTHSAAANDDDTDRRVPSTPTRNAIAAAALTQNERVDLEQFMGSKRLRTEQIATILGIAGDRTPIRDAKMTAQLFALENKLDEGITKKAEWTAPPAFDTDVGAAALAITISSKTNAYKGDTATKLLMRIIEVKAWATAAELKNPSIRKKVRARAQYHLTQARSKIKKAIVASVKSGEELNIVDLTVIIASKGTDVVVNDVLCARVAVMRTVYNEAPSGDFWENLDARLVSIRKRATGDAERIVRAFNYFLKEDRKKYTAADVYEVNKDASTAFQDDIDKLIAANRASVTAPEAGSDDDPFTA